MGRRSRLRGFTLVELLVVIAIIALLLALLVPAVQAARESARLLHCANNVKQLCMAVHNYQSQRMEFPAGARYRGAVPSASNPSWCNVVIGWQNFLAPWTVAVLPYLEHTALHERFDLESSFMDNQFAVPLPNGASGNMVPIPTFQCASSRSTNPLRNNYFGVQGGGNTPSCADDTGVRHHYINGVLYANSRITPAHVRDGTSNVLLIGETRWCTFSDGYGNTPSGGQVFTWLISGKIGRDAIPLQVAGVNLPLNADVPPDGWRILDYGSRGFGSDHPGGATFGRADGSVHFVSDSVSHSTLQNMAQRSDGSIDQVLP